MSSTGGSAIRTGGAPGRIGDSWSTANPPTAEPCVMQREGDPRVSTQPAPALIEEIRLTSVKSVMEHLRPSNSLWAGPYRLWGFRGQADAAWFLTPTAFRDGFGEHTAATAPTGSLKHQVLNELGVFEEFLFLANEVGLRVPGADYVMGEEFNTTRREESWWPHPPLVPGIALAQHHGIPTRFLDFTYNALIAAYFAAYQRWTAPPDVEFVSPWLAVWAVNLHFIHHAHGNAEGRRIDSINVPSSDNPFLQAQRGFFLWDRQANKHWRPGSIDQVVLQRGGEDQAWKFIDREPQHIRRWARPPVIRKLLISHGLTRPLLSALFKQERISSAHLMPQLDSVRSTYFFQRELWDTKREVAVKRTAPRSKR